MSLLRLFRQPRLTPVFSTTLLAPRTFSSTPLLRLKEDKQQSPDEIEKAKQEQLRTGDRKRELESHSEENVKADQEHKDVEDHGAHIEELQKETARKSEEGK